MGNTEICTRIFGRTGQAVACVGLGGEGGVEPLLPKNMRLHNDNCCYLFNFPVFFSEKLFKFAWRHYAKPIFIVIFLDGLFKPLFS